MVNDIVLTHTKQAAAAAFAQDVGAGLAKPVAPVASSSSGPKKPSVKPSNPYANYSTAQSLGFVDPDAERLAAEAEVRRSQGIAGDWQVVSTSQAPVVPSSREASEPAEGLDSEPDAAGSGVKREAEAPPDDEDTRAFKLRKKTVAMGLGEIYDPGLIPIKVKKKEKDEPVLPVKPEPASTAASIQESLKWTPTHWKTPSGVKVEGESPKGYSTLAPSTSNKWAKPQWAEPLPDVKQEDRTDIFGAQAEGEPSTAVQPGAKAEPDVKTEEIEQEESLPPAELSTSSGVVFKKRKAPASSARGRRDV